MRPTDRKTIIKTYHATLDTMGIRTWAGFLEDDYWLRASPDSNWGTCTICGKTIHARYIGSHFRQTRTNFLEHQKAVDRYSATLKHVLNSILRKHGLRLRDGTDQKIYAKIQETARLSTQWFLDWWNETVEPLEKKDEKMPDQTFSRQKVINTKQHNNYQGCVKKNGKNL